MTPKLQQQVSQFVQTHNLETTVPYRLLDLISELGEVSKELLKATNYGQNELDPTTLSPDWADEVGDVLFSLICLANVTGVDLEEAVQNALLKYQKRLSQTQDAGSGR